MKKILSLLALAALTIGLLGSCKKEDPKVSVTGVTLDKTTLEITVGAPDVKLTAAVAPENATDKTVSWSSDKTDVATVDQEGNVHAVAEGAATITVTTTDGNKTGTCAVTVKAAKVPVTDVTLDKTELTLTVGDDDVKLTATVAPENATDKTVSWSSDKTDVATVDQEGNVHAVAEGAATITVTTTDGNKTGTCAVTVKAAKVPVTDVTLDKTELTLTVGDADVKLTATVAPENATDKTVSWSSDKTDVATVDQEGNVHAVAEGAATIIVTTTDGNKTGTCAVTVKAAIPEGALSGEFSVSATKQVHFSQGNLWYGKVGSATTETWNFETNQYDSTPASNDNWNESHVSHFFWSKDASVACAASYSESGSSSDVFFTNETETTAKADFTVNVGGNEQNGWRTLSTAEWQYLFNTRTMTNGKKRYSNAVSGVTIGGTTYKGVFLYPDNYNGEVVSGSMTWDAINAAGIVFLPAAGYRYGSNVLYVGDFGYYWSSTAYDEDYAYYVYFSSSNVGPGVSDRRSLGFSVRLITESK